ncbi:MAG: NAD(P)-dependent alcohol dehydrogenase [Parachlamydiales bacterium]|nr:NAD(P)-dependent alcohol dehydrogenase [Parachlamydiales bacterium]
MNNIGYAATSSTSPLSPFKFFRREPGPKDVNMEILYCGICHSDLHAVRSEWPGTIYPIVPGHEIVGRILKVGSMVKKFKVGDIAAVGCMVDSCRKCDSCLAGNEQFCEVGCIYTYNSPNVHTKGITYGGYASHMVADEDFVLRVPTSYKEKDLAGVAPLLCAGITTYSPLRYWKIGKGSKVGVVGLGGLGHMAIKLAHAMEARVVLFTSSSSKIEDGKRLGADEVILTKDPKNLESNQRSFDLIIDTVAVQHDLNPYINLLKQDGAMCLVGVPEKPHPALNVFNLIKLRRKLVGSLIGGIKETQEMLDFCASNNITSDVEVIPMDKVNEAYNRLVKGDVKYRFTIDMSTLDKSSLDKT